MNKDNFSPNTRYVVTWRNPEGKLRPANLYVYQLYDDCMIARMVDANGLLHKIPYTDIVKIVSQQAVPENDRFRIPVAVLDAKNWKDRTVKDRYSSSPGSGK